MRVGLTLSGSLDGQSGGFRYDRKLVEGLRAAGDTVEVVSLPRRTYPRDLLAGVSRSLRNRLEVDVEVMLQDELAHPSLVGVNPTLSYPTVSVVHHLRASEPRRLAPLYRAVERRYLASVDGAVCNSHATRETVAATGGPPAERTVVAPPAGDRFDPDVDGEIADRAREGPLRVVFVGNVEPRKGLDTLVDGLARLDEPWTLTAVGRHRDASYVRTVRRRVAATGTGERVRLTGRLSEPDLAAILRASHVLAVPSRYEGFGIVYLEGMSFGLPAIGTTAGGAREVIEDGETGYLVEPDDPAALAGVLSALAGDRDRLARMGQAARDRYERQPGWTETTERVRSLLQAVAETDGSDEAGTTTAGTDRNREVR